MRGGGAKISATRTSLKALPPISSPLLLRGGSHAEYGIDAIVEKSVYINSS